MKSNCVPKNLRQSLSALFFVAVVFSLVGSSCAADTSSYLNGNTSWVKSITPVIVPPSTDEVAPPVFNTTTILISEQEESYLQNQVDSQTEQVPQVPPAPILEPLQEPIVNTIPPPVQIDTPTETAPTQKVCCKYCTTGKACGDSCISRSYTCHKPPGCACNSY